jgi:hypothetical protein
MSKTYSYPKTHKPKYDTDLCDDKMTFQECELAILRHAVDESEKLQGQKVATSEDVKKMIKIVEDFLIEKKLICYGGTAINNILPKYAQFYDKELEVPDYDFYSDNALADAKELADKYYEAGYREVETKAGVHAGTFKVFVNFIPVADITFLHSELFEAIKRESITIAGIKYAPANYLRMSMYLELSRPAGDVSRWEKVLKRLTLLNKYYPMSTSIAKGAIKPCNNKKTSKMVAGSIDSKSSDDEDVDSKSSDSASYRHQKQKTAACNTMTVNCSKVDFQRKLTSNMEESEQLYFTTRDILIEQGVIFFGGYATSLYSRHMPQKQRRLVEKIPDFDVLAEDPERCSMITRERLIENGFDDVDEIVHEEIGEIIPQHIEIRVGKNTVAFIYKPVACHNYNTINMGDKEINVATIDTMLSFYLAFIYADKPYYHKERILCMAKFLFDVEQNNRLAQKGLLKRFSTKCYGKQKTLEDMRAEKTSKFKELADKRGTEEYEMWFLKYSPTVKYGNEPIEQPKNKKTTAKQRFVMPDSKLPQPELMEEPVKKKRNTKKNQQKQKKSWFGL